jgi:hypothetical protein
MQAVQVRKTLRATGKVTLDLSDPRVGESTIEESSHVLWVEMGGGNSLRTHEEKSEDSRLPKTGPAFRASPDVGCQLRVVQFSVPEGKDLL